MARDLELVQFRYSPYNEKARWGRDFKGLPHRRRSLLPGPHMRATKRLSGQTATPILVIDGEAVAGSARILERLEREASTPALFPADPALRAEAVAIERRFDEDLTPRIRRAVLAAILDDAGYVARVFGADHGGLARTLYAATFPLARGLVRKGNGIGSQADIDDGCAAATEALDFVVDRTATTGYLVGDRFTLADLAAAASLAPLVDPDHPDMRRREPMPDTLRQWLARWRAHPGAAWIDEMYRKHRPMPATPAG